jgi:predicted DNA-binding transcriptional regulator YafY
MPATNIPRDRLNIIDQLLSIGRKFTFDELLDRLNDRLTADWMKVISARTLRDDLKALKNEYDAPLFKATNSEPYYYYTRKFTIKESLLSDEDVSYLKQAATILKKVAGLGFGVEVDEIIKKLENRAHTNIPERSNFIQFENQIIANGLNWLDDIFNAIKEKSVIRIYYQPFHYDNPVEYSFHPYLLKQYRNRWFVFGRNEEEDFIKICPLDRIKSVKNSTKNFIENDLFEPETYFNNLVGVSPNKDSKIETIVLKVEKSQLPYILSKPIHINQELVKKYKNGDAKIKLNLFVNYELVSQLLGYGSSIEVLEPQFLRDEINNTILKLINKYTN